MKVLKIYIGTWDNASHDKRELSVCEELGAETEVLAKEDENHKDGYVDGFWVHRMTARPLGKWVPVSVNRVVALFKWAGYVRKRDDIDVISGHDITGLLIGYMSNIGKNKKAQLVYDSHEFELSTSRKRNVIPWNAVRILEKYLMNRVSFSTMVSDSIADDIMKIHRLKQRPVVVRNMPDRWTIDEAAARRKREELLSSINYTKDSFIVVYHGSVTSFRGIEKLIEAVSMVDKCVLLILGNGDFEYMDFLRKKCHECKIGERVIFHEAVPHEILKNYVAAADVGVSLLPPVALSYVYALPNKLFENVQCLNPVIVSDFPEVGGIIDSYDIGIRVNPEDAKSIAAGIQRLMNDKELFSHYKANLIKAKEELCWEREKKKLEDAYRTILK